MALSAARVYLMAKMPLEAAIQFQRACEICYAPEFTIPYAWVLCTDPLLRNPEMAIGLARYSVNVSRSARNLDLLATAFAACGDFTQAIDLSKKEGALAARCNGGR